MPIELVKPLCGLALMVLLPASGSADLIYGTKLPGALDPIYPHSQLYSFESDGSNFNVIGELTVAGQGVDVDGLAISATHGLVGFMNTATGSTMLSINPGTATATTIGSELTGRFIRGGVFDLSDRLWILDDDGDQLLQINAVTGGILGTINVLDGGSPFDVHNGDLAVDAFGNVYLTRQHPTVFGLEIYDLNTASGAVSLLHHDTVDEDTGGDAGLFAPNAAGATFTNGAPSSLFTFDTSVQEDILRYETAAGYARSEIYSNVIPSFNSGTGDLAGLMSPVPEPTSLLPAALVGLLLFGTRRRRTTNE